jgi:hypothetical protein
MIVANGYSAAFGFTGIDGFGLQKLIKPGFKEAGYVLDYSVLGADLETSQMLEEKRERPASPEDFDSKRADFIVALPKYFDQCDRVRLFMTRLDQEPLPVAEWTKSEGAVFCVPENLEKFIDFVDDERGRLLAQPQTAAKAQQLAPIPAFLIEHLAKPEGSHLSLPGKRPGGYEA